MKFSAFSFVAAFLPTALRTAQALDSEVFYFPGDASHYFMVNPITLPTHWSLEAWVYLKENNYFLSYAVQGGSDNCFLHNANGAQLNEWQHVMLTWDGVAQKIFYNGVLGPNGHGATTDCTTSPGSFVIGQDQDTVGGGFIAAQSPKMYLDTVAIYDRAWTDSEIAERCLRTCVDMSDPNLFGLWLDSSGTDHSGNGNTAQVVPQTTDFGEYGKCDDGTCFHADGTVLLESGEKKRFSELKIGEVIRTSDGQGAFSFSPVLTLPHAANSEPASFLNLTTETGKSVIMTPGHYIPRCDHDEVTASKLVVGDCLVTVDGKETLVEVTSVEKKGVYTATTQDKFLVVDGIVASPYSKNSRPTNKAGWDLSKYGGNLMRGKERVASYFKKQLRGSAQNLNLNLN